MGEIDKLQPAYQIPPTRPAAGGGNRAPQRKPASRDAEKDKQRRHSPDDDKPAHVDEYA